MGGRITPTSISTNELERQLLQLEGNTSPSSAGAPDPETAGGDSAPSPAPLPVVASTMARASASSRAAGTPKPPGLVLCSGMATGGGGGGGSFGSGVDSGGVSGGVSCAQKPELNATAAISLCEAHGQPTGRLPERPGFNQTASDGAGSLSHGPLESACRNLGSLAENRAGASGPEADLEARAGPRAAQSGDGVGPTGGTDSGLGGGGDGGGGGRGTRSGVGSMSSEGSASEFQRVTIGLTLAAAASSDISTSESVAAALLAVGHVQDAGGHAGGRQGSSDSRSGSGTNSGSRGSSGARNLQQPTQPHRLQDSSASEPLVGRERSSGHSTSGGSSVLFRPMGRCESVPEEAVFGPRAQTVPGMECGFEHDTEGALGAWDATVEGGGGAALPEGADGPAEASTARHAGRLAATPSPAGGAPEEGQPPAPPSPFMALAGRSFSVHEREESQHQHHQQQQRASRRDRAEPVFRAEHVDHTPPTAAKAPMVQAPAPAAPMVDPRVALDGSLRLNSRPVAGANTRRASTGASGGSEDLAAAMSPKGAPPTPSASVPAASMSSSSPWHPPPGPEQSLTLLPVGDFPGSGDGRGRLHTVFDATCTDTSGGRGTGDWRASGAMSGGGGTGLGPLVPYSIGGSDASVGPVAVGAGGAVTLQQRPDGSPSRVIQSLPLPEPSAGAASSSGGGGAAVGTAAYAATALMLLESYGTGSDWATSNMGGADFGGSAMRGLRLSGAGGSGAAAASQGTSSLHLTGLTLASVEGGGGSGVVLALGGAAADGRGGSSFHSPLTCPLDGTLVRRPCLLDVRAKRAAGMADCAWQPLRTPLHCSAALPWSDTGIALV